MLRWLRNFDGEAPIQRLNARLKWGRVDEAQQFGNVFNEKVSVFRR